MPDEITPELFAHLVELAALDLDEKEAAYLRDELNKQLRAIDELIAIPVDPEIPPAAHGVPYPPQISQEMRSDEWAAFPDPEAIIAQAPETEDGHILVPDIPHEELE